MESQTFAGGHSGDLIRFIIRDIVFHRFCSLAIKEAPMDLMLNRVVVAYHLEKETVSIRSTDGTVPKEIDVTVSIFSSHFRPGQTSTSYLSHNICLGRIRCWRTTESTQALFCPQCGLRIVIPLTVTTLGLLHNHFHSLQ